MIGLLKLAAAAYFGWYVAKSNLITDPQLAQLARLNEQALAQLRAQGLIT